MERPCRVATKVTDFRRYHLSGDLDQEVEGLVDTRIGQFKMAKSNDQLQQQLETEKENSRQLQEDVECQRIKNEVETERMKQEQWKAALERLREAREHAAQEHEKVLQEMKGLAKNNMEETSNAALTWLKTQMDSNTGPCSLPTEEQKKAKKIQMEKETALQKLREQQEQIQNKIAKLQGHATTDTSGLLSSLKETLNPEEHTKRNQETMLQQLRMVLSGQKEEDPNKALLKALLTQQNKTGGKGGTSTLKPNLISKILQGENFNIAEWLASLNKQEGESDPNHFPFPGEEDQQNKLGKGKSGMLEKATTNIQQKQVWPQQNLREDWADEDIEFKQIHFEHLVAGETRTIEMCSEPAEILGRL